MNENKAIECIRQACQSGYTVICEGIKNKIPNYLESIIEKAFYFSPND